ncbi:hypothetical protein [Streptomyces sp. CAU 1734]|uniref:hypothetical protein n=1 Tax=Streptomyces sp. CAU 1734 TaxID=3140360 RepID=UPI003260C1F9
MTEPEPDLLSRLWKEHLRTPFPPHIRGREFTHDGMLFDMVLLDADIAGCVSSTLSGPLDEQRQRTLLVCLAAVEAVLPSIDDEDGAIEYYERLRHMAALAVKAGSISKAP